MIKYFIFYSIRRRFLTLEGALSKLPPSKSVDPELGDIEERINFLEETTHNSVEDFD